MPVSHEEAREIITAEACGLESPERIEAVREHIGQCPQCGRWQEEVESLVGELGDMVPDVPAALDDSVRDLIRRGAPEDPWLVILEVADEVVDISQVGALGLNAAESDEWNLSEAADLTAAAGAPSIEELVRTRFRRVEHVTGSQGEQILITTPDSRTWVGVVLSESGVPLSEVKVRWTGGRGRVQEGVTDARGSFVFEDDCGCPISLVIGAPVAIEHHIE